MQTSALATLGRTCTLPRMEPGAERALRFSRQLEAEDVRLAAELREVGELEVETEDVRSRAVAADAFLSRLPAEREGASTAVRAAEEELERKREALVRAESELGVAERGRNEEALAEARRAVVRARDAASMARKKLERAVAALEDLERRAATVASQLPGLAESAERLSQRLATVARLSRQGTAPPESGLAGTIDWSRRALAALFVARSGLESQREGVVRQANELAASVVGEGVAATSVEGARRRVEAALAAGEPG